MGLQQRLTGIAALLLVAISSQEMVKGDSPGGESTIYDASPQHLWNRMNDTLFIRTGTNGIKYGYDEIDPLIWENSKYLLQGDLHRRAVAVLDEFLQRHGEKLVRDLVKRAWLQHDLWFLFDWVAMHANETATAREQKELEMRLAEVIRRLELTPQEIESMPDNYERAHTNAALDGFADGLFKRKGDWAFFGISGDELIAPLHEREFGGRSTFAVAARFPGGRAEAEAYVAQLTAFTPWWVTATNIDRHYVGANNELSPPTTNVTAALNRGLPQFPVGTEWALVRRMCVIDSKGEIQPTHLVESIQARRFVAINLHPTNGVNEHFGQEVAEFIMDRRHGGELRATGPDEQDFLTVHFFSQGVDPFEPGGPGRAVAGLDRFRGKVLADCYACHASPGIGSVNSVTGRFGNSRLTAIPLYLTEGMDREELFTSRWKNGQFDWGLLQGIWLGPK